MYAFDDDHQTHRPYELQFDGDPQNTMRFNIYFGGDPQNIALLKPYFRTKKHYANVANSALNTEQI